MTDNLKIGVSVDDLHRMLGGESGKASIKGRSLFIPLDHPSKDLCFHAEIRNPFVIDAGRNEAAKYAATALWEMIAANRKGDEVSPSPAAEPAPAATTWDIGFLHDRGTAPATGHAIIKLADMPGSRKRWAVWTEKDGTGHMWTEGKVFTPAGIEKAKAMKMQYLRSMHLGDDGIAQLLDDQKLEAAWQG